MAEVDEVDTLRAAEAKGSIRAAGSNGKPTEGGRVVSKPSNPKMAENSKVDEVDDPPFSIDLYSPTAAPISPPARGPGGRGLRK